MREDIPKVGLGMRNYLSRYLSSTQKTRAEQSSKELLKQLLLKAEIPPFYDNP